MTSKTPRAIRLLTQFGADALYPTIVNGRYMGPMVPRRIAANLRKRSLIDGTYGTFVPSVGGWDASWEKPAKLHLIKPFKGHKRERTRDDRVAKIDAAMATMDDRFKKYAQDVESRKPKRDLLFFFNRIEKQATGRRW